jgi:Smr domain
MPQADQPNGRQDTSDPKIGSCHIGRGDAACRVFWVATAARRRQHGSHGSASAIPNPSEAPAGPTIVDSSPSRARRNPHPGHARVAKSGRSRSGYVNVANADEGQRVPTDKLRSVPSANLGEPTLDLHGLRVREALRRTDGFLTVEQARGTLSVRIITGHGTGVLKQAIGELLRGHPSVASVVPLQGDAVHLIVLRPAVRR